MNDTILQAAIAGRAFTGSTRCAINPTDGISRIVGLALPASALVRAVLMNCVVQTTGPTGDKAGITGDQKLLFGFSTAVAATTAGNYTEFAGTGTINSSLINGTSLTTANTLIFSGESNNAFFTPWLNSDRSLQIDGPDAWFSFDDCPIVMLPGAAFMVKLVQDGTATSEIIGAEFNFIELPIGG